MSKLSRTAASPRGKAQESIMAYLAKSSQVVELTDMAAIPSLRGVHFDKIMSAVEALQKKGLVRVQGTKVSPKAASASRVAANWIQDAIKRPGRLHKFFKVPEGEDIPEEKIEGEIKTLRKKKERSKKDTSLLRALNLAETLESFHKSAHLLTPVQRRAAVARLLLERH